MSCGAWKCSSMLTPHSARVCNSPSCRLGSSWAPGQEGSGDNAASLPRNELLLLVDDVAFDHGVRPGAGDHEEIGRQAAAGDLQAQPAGRRDPQDLSLLIARIAGVHDAGGARRDHRNKQDGHGVVDLAQSGGQPVEQRPFVEASGDDSSKGVEGLVREERSKG